MGQGRDDIDYDSAEDGAYGDFGGLLSDAALMPIGEAGLPVIATGPQTGPVLIPGTGVSMGTPFIKRRERPLTMRLAMITVMACLLVTGLFAVSPLSGSGAGGGNAFELLSGSVDVSSAPSYHWYTAQAGDSLESIAKRFHVQIGGIFELNGLLAGQDITIGKAYKIPDDPFYGQNYRPPVYVPPSNGSTTFGSSPWVSVAGAPPEGAECAQYNGNGVPLAYHLVGPNPNSYWVRGFTWYHNGVDISTVAGNPIHAAQTGEVIWAGWDVGGLGYSIKINNCYGIATMYGHMEQLLVHAGENVSAGQTIGLEGSTGWSTGPHLHFMVEVNNVPVDPAAYFGFNCNKVTGSTHYASTAYCD